jgi:hypothetical protein
MMVSMNAADTIHQRVTTSNISTADAVGDVAGTITVPMLDVLNKVALGTHNDALGGTKRRMERAEGEQIAQNSFNSNSSKRRRLYHARALSANLAVAVGVEAQMPEIRMHCY